MQTLFVTYSLALLKALQVILVEFTRSEVWLFALFMVLIMWHLKFLFWNISHCLSRWDRLGLNFFSSDKQSTDHFFYVGEGEIYTVSILIYCDRVSGMGRLDIPVFFLLIFSVISVFKKKICLAWTSPAAFICKIGLKLHV